MQPPCEIMTEYFLPNMRGIVAHELYDKGESQRRIANMLGITQARVSNYLSNKKSFYHSELIKRFGTTEPELEGYAKILSEDVARSEIDGIFTLYSIWKNMLFNGAVCAIHQKVSSIPKDCSICMDLHRPQSTISEVKKSADEESNILRELSEALTKVENSSTFPQIMPEVSVNIAMCKSEPESKRDVAAIPGRVNKIHGRAKAFVLPEFGSSNHMSNVLLLFNNKSKYVRAVINLRHDQIMDRSLNTLGIRKIFTKSRHEPFSFTQERKTNGDQILLERLANVKIPESVSSNELPFSVIDKGSEGLEPMTYLFGSKAKEITEIALRISDSYVDLVQTKTV